MCWSLWRPISLSLGNSMKFYNETGQQRTLPVQEHEAPRRRQLPAPTYSHGYAGYEGICHLVVTPVLAAGTSWQSKAWGLLMADSGDCISKLEKSRERWNTPCLILERQFLLVNGLQAFGEIGIVGEARCSFWMTECSLLPSSSFKPTERSPFSDGIVCHAMHLLFKTWQNLHLRETVEASLKPHQLTSEKTLVSSRYPGWFIGILITA